jgi:2-polyprenyl-6-hydroxyphenyl methylase/3-demethylubiquinone-9 3-methyltransferase
MQGYYNVTLSAAKLKKCYDIAPSRVRQYLQAEIDFVLQKINRKDVVLDLGCGYGRLIPMLAKKAKFVHGIDNSETSLKFGKEYLRDTPRHMLHLMDAVKLTFSANTMDVVCCLQNGISAFNADQRTLIKEAVRVTRPGGCALFSTYSEKFWEPRLKWFMQQSKAGLIGELDMEKTRNGHIVCKDGFKVLAINPKKFIELTRWIRGIKVSVKEVDDSCLFFLIKKVK